MFIFAADAIIVSVDTTHYETLGVPEDADQEEIRASYRKLVRKYHPDIIGEEGAVKTARVNDAYGVLSDPDSRIVYDADLRRERQRSEEPLEYVIPHSDETYPEGAFTQDVSAPEAGVEDDEPLRFVHYWDHPVNRRKLILGAIGIPFFIAAVICATMLGKMILPAGAALIAAAVITVRWRMHYSAFLVVAIGTAVAVAMSLTIPSYIFAGSLLLSIYPLRLGYQNLSAIVSAVNTDHRERANARREQMRQEKAREKEAKYQKQAAQRRAARQAKRDAKGR